jgi:hypothetical protein
LLLPPHSEQQAECSVLLESCSRKKDHVFIADKIPCGQGYKEFALPPLVPGKYRAKVIAMRLPSGPREGPLAIAQSPYFAVNN